MISPVVVVSSLELTHCFLHCRLQREGGRGRGREGGGEGERERKRLGGTIWAELFVCMCACVPVCACTCSGNLVCTHDRMRHIQGSVSEHAWVYGCGVAHRYGLGVVQVASQLLQDTR